MMDTSKKTKKISWSAVAVISMLLMIVFVSRPMWSSAKKNEPGNFCSSVVSLEYDEAIYTGSRIEPAVSVMIEQKQLEAGKDYDVCYFMSDVPGTAYVLVSGKGAYEGQKFLSYRILTQDEVCDQPGNESLVRFICAWYRCMFKDHIATVDEIRYWVDRVHNMDESFIEELAGLYCVPESDIYEYSLDELIDRVYRAFYDRMADTSSIEYWAGMIEDGQIDRDRFIFCILESDRFAGILDRCSEG